MISVERLKVEFGVKPLFSDATFVVGDRDRIALVGKNGAGKSTLLKILCGMEHATSGTVSMTQDSTIGYLPQVMKLQDDTTVREEARKAFAHMQRLADRLERLEREMSERTDYESADYMALVERYTTEHERYQLMGADGYEGEMERTLTGLGFLRSDFDRPTSEFSGGWRMRIELAKILLRRPDVLLLDEPTKGLDAPAKAQVGAILADLALREGKAVLLTTHDLEFVSEVAHTCSMLFGREVTCTQDAHGFFKDNLFYSTPTARIARGMVGECVTTADLAAALELGESTRDE